MIARLDAYGVLLLYNTEIIGNHVESEVQMAKRLEYLLIIEKAM